jgi:pimeloyl-ACP methyl ester carboxylesterase
MRERTVEANGVTFAFLELGEGPLVLLFHGFPDNALTWDRVMPSLAEAGYRTVAPFMRGYPPTGVPPDGRYDAAALGDDVAISSTLSGTASQLL